MSSPGVAVAYSGGRDSTALLHATVAAAGPIGVHVVALHVHHGLSEHADGWLAHCERTCARWSRRRVALRFASTRLAGQPAAGDSIEAWARAGRYQALRDMALANDVALVLLGQHRRDQAETLLLQALRGAGPAGLAGMPARVQRDGVTWARPWLGQTREAIDGYLKRHRLSHIEDDSNGDARLLRNRLRLRVWPDLIEAFPAAETALAVTAAWAGEAAHALAELAEIDGAAACVDDALVLARWRELSIARRSNLLRAWLKARIGRPAPATLVVRLVSELAGDRAARWPLTGGELRSHRGRLVFVPSAFGATGGHATGLASSLAQALPAETSLSATRAGRYPLPGWSGVLRLDRVAQGGLAAVRCRELELRPRAGAERFQLADGRPARPLKKQYQALDIPVWQREGPLVYSHGELVYVPGLGLDARAIAPVHEAQLLPTWLPG